MFFELVQNIVTLCELILNWDFDCRLFSHFLRLFFQKFVNFFDSDSFGTTLDFLSVFDIS